MSDCPKCELCGEPMPEGESMFKFHGYSGDCPRKPIRKLTPEVGVIAAVVAEIQSDPAFIDYLQRELSAARAQLTDRDAELALLREDADSRLAALKETLRLLNVDSSERRYVIWNYVDKAIKDAARRERGASQ